MPAERLQVVAHAPGLLQQSRVASDLFRFAQLALPNGTHRVDDMFQHVKVTAVAFVIAPNSDLQRREHEALHMSSDV